jgi:hypothetical protein
VTELPTWDQMSDLDKGAALLHMLKRDWEGADYAVEHYPCQYIEDPALLALSERDACRHAKRVCVSGTAIRDRLRVNERHRLCRLVLNEGSKILDSRKLWGVRHENGNVSACDTEREARFLVFNPSWRCAELLHRSEPGGGWTVEFDARGMEQESELGWVRAGDSVLWDGQWREVRSKGHVMRSFERSRNCAVSTVDFTDGTHVEMPPYWEIEQDTARWTVQMRRRTAIPEGAHR